jgi:nucleoside-triphosphatase THEP1
MPDPCIAAVLYAPGQSTRPVLDAFIAALSSRGLNVHGLVQEPIKGHGMDAIDIRTAERIPIKRPTRYEITHKLCSLNLGQLADATRVLRRALDEHADIVVVERFGKTERDGGGLADDLLALMASGTPTVVTVPIEEYDAWTTFSGGLGNTVPCEFDALMAWWDKTS